MVNWSDYVLFGVIQVAMLVGMFGALVPFFPGIFIMWLAALGYGFIAGWSTLGILLFILMTVLLVISTLIDNVLMGAGAQRGGAHWVSIIVALVVGVAFTILFPPFGGIIAAPLSVFLIEWVRLREARKAWKALIGMAAGYGISYFVRFGLGMLIMAMWWLWVWKG